jgi:hypothetical protein
MYHGLMACKELLRHQIFTIQQNALILRYTLQKAYYSGLFVLS